MKVFYIFSAIILMTGCTSIKVQKLDAAMQVSHVCIEENPKVIVVDFLPVVQNGFTRHGITTEIYKESAPNYCEFSLTYTALKNWDMGTYMHHAELWLNKDKKNIAYAKYHLNGKGGLALNKWASVESKMDPVIDELLFDYSPQVVDVYRKVLPTNILAGSDITESKDDQLRKLKAWLTEGLISDDEYKSEKQKVLEQ